MSESFRALRSIMRARYRSGFRVLIRRNQAPKYPGSRRWGSDANSESARPLDGVRVLDLTRVLAGPFATMILGDLGAEVIKVERPGGGDDTRTWGPPFVASESVYFLSVNRNKKSIAVDLKHRRGAEVIQQLAGYGQTGPQARSPGYDSIASAVSGMMHITGPEDGEPVRPGVAMTDLATGLYAHGAVMAALLHRQKTGRGSHIDCNLLSAQVSCLSHIAANYLNAGKEAKRWGTAHESIVPYQGFRTRDGHLVLAAANDRQFVTVCQVLELQDLAADPNYRTNQLRVQNRKQLLQILSQRFLQQSSADWLRRFQGSGVPVGPINSIQEVFSEPQVKHNGLIQEMEHPTAGRITVPGPAVRFSSFPPSGPTPPPLIGQHTIQVLRDTLSYSDDVIKELLESRAVAQNEVF
ncbi:succinate--hydroxymethylglutarate CoA-transferase isoform X2 [Gambusia affinis]|uniref:succinate--hydroxymethylglutarate CoA-transferase isoform X2 n=1 Tax=Gambusia affinis TaxID=33528 RepID=UPI001CDD0159|nr:succinate--hydroxymethylglutarate CoA-transferase isoform X2 [Gambusia affinis]